MLSQQIANKNNCLYSHINISIKNISSCLYFAMIHLIWYLNLFFFFWNFYQTNWNKCKGLWPTQLQKTGFGQWSLGFLSASVAFIPKMHFDSLYLLIIYPLDFFWNILEKEQHIIYAHLDKSFLCHAQLDGISCKRKKKKQWKVKKHNGIDIEYVRSKI